MTETDARSATRLTQTCVNCQRAYLAGDVSVGDEIFERLCREFEPTAARISGRILQSAGILNAVEDAVQESLLAIWKEIRAGKFDQTCRFEPWANTITRRTTISVGRNQKCRSIITDLLRDDTLKDSGDEPSSALEVIELFEQVTNLLSDDEFRLLKRKYCDSLSLMELGVEYGTTSDAIRGRINRIKERVRESLSIPANSQTKERVKL